MFSYKIKDGKYWLDDFEVGDEVTILFTTGSNEQAMWTMHKHGSYKDVLPHFEVYSQIYKTVPAIGKPHIITGKFPVEKLNQVINTSGYIRIFVKAMGIEIDQ